MLGKPGETVFEQYEVESPIATELRRLYNNIRRLSDGSPLKSVLLTSSTRNEGKSTITAYLAVTIAQFPRKKVLVVDADLRRPKMHTMFGLDEEQGLSECLVDPIDPMKLVKKTHMPNLDVITCGTKHEAPSRLFESERLAEVLNKIQFYYDVVLVDSAPVIPVSDTLFLCPEIEWVLFVVLTGVTPRDVVLRARTILADAKANVAGVVVNNVTQVLPHSYDYDYYESSERE